MATAEPANLRDQIICQLGRRGGAPASALDLANEIFIEGMDNHAKARLLISAMNAMVESRVLQFTNDPSDRRSYDPAQVQYQLAVGSLW